MSGETGDAVAATGVLPGTGDRKPVDPEAVGDVELAEEPQPATAAELQPRLKAERPLGAMLGRWSVSDLVSLAVALACGLFVFAQMRPDLLLADTTPSGGDMGAHVWGPAFLRDHLLSEGRLVGWTPDWYAGFPAYRFYMVVPSLAIVAVNAGLRPWIAVPLVVAIVAATFVLTKDSDRKIKIRLFVGLASLLLLSVPYGIAFKLVSVSGLIAFPIAAWAMGRLARAPEPIPALLPIGALFFLFDTNFTIYGGNIASTLAGEFAFSISLSLSLLAFGLAARGMDTGRWRTISAIVISLIALTHLIPVFFAMTALVVLVVMGPSVPRLWPVACAIALALVPVALADGTSGSVTALAIGAVVVVFAAVVAAEPEVRERATWLVVTGPTAALLSAFWLLPFYLREPFFNDMGWERLDEVGPAMLTVPMKVALPVAAVGAIGAVALRERVGLLFATTGLVFAAAVANLGEGPLWNARLLPFYYLSVYLLAAVGVGVAVRFAAVAVSEDFNRPDRRITTAASVLFLVGGLIAVAMPLRILPRGVEDAEGTYTWMKLTSHAKSFLPSWTAWNYSGYEEKASYREYRSVVSAMDQVGQVNGCGRAMWEYDKELDRYGTPMALMLLPHWTDGCIGSMEGLYFESSATTPFHFLNQSMLSQNPSRAQRDLPYQDFDIDRGIAQLQVMGVRYYMAQEDASIAAAREHPDLSEVAEAQPFVIFEVAGSQLVEGLRTEPVVVEGRTAELAGEAANRFDIGWVGQAVTFYNDPAAFQALPAEDGPDDWQRVEALLPTDGEPAQPVTVSDVRVGTSSVEFSVDEVGSPVLVKVSYFPNWKVDGAEGPWRVGPNLMAVVPTDTRVKLTYGRSLVEWLGTLATLLGVGALVGLYAADRRRWSEIERTDVWGGHERDWDETLTDLGSVGTAAGPTTSEASRPNGELAEPQPGVETTLSTEVSRDDPSSP
ncbi:MAG: hypothetical protein OEV40_07635 [Acidimicrobiia bacterium]|nr:hypothetical protein [Acidimicrobiia bacterium]